MGNKITLYKRSNLTYNTSTQAQGQIPWTFDRRKKCRFIAVLTLKFKFAILYR